MSVGWHQSVEVLTEPSGKATLDTGGAGPYLGHPPVDAMVQQSTLKLPRPKGTAKEPDHGLITDLLAVAGMLRLSSSAPAPPRDFNFDESLGELTDFLPDAVGLPMELDTAWGAYASASPTTIAAPLPLKPTPVSPVQASPAPVSPIQASSTLVSLVRASPSPVSPAPVSTTPASPSPVSPAPVSPAPVSPAPVSTTPASTTPASPSPVSPAPVSPAPVSPEDLPPPIQPTAVSLDTAMDATVDKEEWECEESTDPWAAVNLIRASLKIKKRPRLPSPPARHPSANWHNTFDPKAAIDPDAVYHIRKLIDRHGKPPHVSYLVEWDVKPCQLSWEWPENLKGVFWCIDQVNEWKKDGSSMSFNAFYGTTYRGAAHSEESLCFLFAFQGACFGLGRLGLVNRDHWSRFCAEQKNEFPDGVLARDIDAFFNFLRRDGVQLDYVELFKKQLNQSVPSIARLEEIALALKPGYYIAHIAHDLIEHCVTLVARGPDQPPLIIDGFTESEDPPCLMEPLNHVEYVTKVYALYRVALPPLKRSKKTKKNKKNKKKIRHS